ncbi:diaminopimelate epimerase [Chitinivorax sp. B]|uniref:diaminopimelate epimerase n=1 Tax=Chitinivorax sp. B TaxID=2502235 RepID=UPI0010F46599|nr:diaminopimelate epimerase [Chitinivorax sp. B]
MGKTLRFTKMQGLGNDFMVVDGIHQPFTFSAEQIGCWGDRRFGIGFDQLLLVEPAQTPMADFRYRIFNCDGTEVEQCGNGARCFARFVYDKGFTTKREIQVETAKGVIMPRLEDNGSVTVNMGAPRFQPDQIPFIADADSVIHVLAVADTHYDVSVVSMGNPHAVQVVPNVDQFPVEKIGPLIECHPRFPQKVNAGFMQIVDRGRVRLRVFERAAGETLACGTGACAAVVAGIRRGLLDATVRVDTRGGMLSISWQGEGSPVMMTGPAVTVFEGEITL